MTATLVSFEISENPAPRLDKALARDVPIDASLSRSRMARLLADGAVKVNGVVITDLRAKPIEGDVVEITVEITDDYHVAPEDIPLNVIFEDDDLIVINIWEYGKASNTEFVTWWPIPQQWLNLGI